MKTQNTSIIKFFNTSIIFSLFASAIIGSAVFAEEHQAKPLPEKTIKVNGIKMKPTLTSDLALEMLLASIKKAKELERTVSIVIVGSDGIPLATYRSEDNPFVIYEWALYKAKTAWFKTKNSEVVKEEGIKISKLDKSILLSGIAGGVPLVIDGQRIGGIGVCGAPAEIDREIAEAGKKLLTK